METILRKNVVTLFFIFSFTSILPAYPPVDDDFLHAAGSKLYDDKDNNVWITGINWFGFDTGDYIVHGLWSCYWKDIINGTASLGFNLVRFPLSVKIVNS